MTLYDSVETDLGISAVSSWLCFFEILDAGAVAVCFSILGSCTWKTYLGYFLFWTIMIGIPSTLVILLKLPGRLFLLEHLEARTHIALM